MPQRCIWGPSRAESCPPGGRAHPLTSSTRECDWTQCHCRCNHVKTRSPGVGPALKPATAEETLGEGRDTHWGNATRQRRATGGNAATHRGRRARRGTSGGRELRRDVLLSEPRGVSVTWRYPICVYLWRQPRPPGAALRSSPPPHARDLAAEPCRSPVPGAPARPCLCVPAGPFLLLKCLFPTSCAEILPSFKPK